MIVARHYDNWLEAFLEYSSFGEAPKRMYFWTGVSCISGALRRKIWFDQGYFKWYPNFFIILVAPPGVVSKSTTASIGMSLLRQVEGIRFGPDAVTPAALASAFAEAREGFEFEGAWTNQSVLTFSSSEFGTLYDPQDNQMTNFLIELYDGVDREFSKATKHSGSDSIVNPLMNLLACTTPSWLADNFRENMIAGGLVSRMLFVFAQRKEKFNAYPGLTLTTRIKSMEPKLVDDLRQMAGPDLVGPMNLSPKAREWGEAWYKAHWDTQVREYEADRFGGYIARKQAHLHKLAMILSIAEGDARVITDAHLQLAEVMLNDLEGDFQAVFGQMGRSDTSVHADRLISFVQRYGKVKYEQAYHHMYAYFPSLRDFEPIVLGAVKAGYLRLVQDGGAAWLWDAQPSSRKE